MLFLGLGLIELALCGVLFIALVIAMSVDRHGHDEWKWWIVGVSLVGLSVFYWQDFTLWGPAHVEAVLKDGKVITQAQDRVVLLDMLTSANVWRPIGFYVGLGLLYAIFEFFFGIWRSKNELRERWEDHLKRKLSSVNGERARDELIANLGKEGVVPAESLLTATSTFRDVLRLADAYPTSKVLVSLREIVLRSFDRTSSKARFLTIEISDGGQLGPKILKWQLTRWLTAWTWWWPFYGISLILGDLLIELFRMLSNLLVSLSRRIVQHSFANVFRF